MTENGTGALGRQIEVASLQTAHIKLEGIQRFTKNKPFYQLLTELSCQITPTIQKACILPTAHLRVLFDSQSKLR